MDIFPLILTLFFWRCSEFFPGKVKSYISHFCRRHIADFMEKSQCESVLLSSQYFKQLKDWNSDDLRNFTHKSINQFLNIIIIYYLNQNIVHYFFQRRLFIYLYILRTDFLGTHLSRNIFTFLLFIICRLLVPFACKYILQ